MRFCRLGEPIKNYVLDILPTLLRLEEYFDKYMGSVTCSDNMLYLRGRPDPIVVNNPTEQARLLNMGLGSRIPWYPIRCLALVEDMLCYYQYRTTLYVDLFTDNPLIESTGVYAISPACSESGVIRAYLPDITLDEYYELNNLILDMYRGDVFDILSEHPNNVYILVASDNGYRLIQYEDIRVIRFNEAIMLRRVDE